jgi:hypothetical protein
MVVLAVMVRARGGTHSTAMLIERCSRLTTTGRNMERDRESVCGIMCLRYAMCVMHKESFMRRVLLSALVLGVGVFGSATAYACCCLDCIDVDGATCTQTGCPTSLTTGPCGVQVFLSPSCTACGKACGIATCMNNLTWFGCGSSGGGATCCAKWQLNTTGPCHDCCLGWLCGCVHGCVGGTAACGSLGGCPCQGQSAVNLTADDSYIYCTT